jgi:threonine dehydrogenase-like Zn-dependent dehydrogenase
MLTIVLEKPGTFTVEDRPEPTAGPGLALVRVRRIGVCGTDLHAFAGNQPFFSYPRVLGHELGVEVVDPGSEPHGLRAGDRCSVEPYMNCGVCGACRRGRPNCCVELKVLGVHVDGGMAPLLQIPIRKLHCSKRLDFEQLALVETLVIGAHAVERATVSPQDFVLIIGAGPIGLSVIQFVRIWKAKVAVMDVSDSRLQFCREHFADIAVLKPGPGAEAELKRIGGDLPTCVIDATGNQQSMMGSFALPANGGRIVFVGLFQGDVTFNDPNFHRRELTVLASRNALPATFRDVVHLIEDGAIDTRPWITHRLKLADVPSAFPRDIAGNPAVLKAMIEA